MKASYGVAMTSRLLKITGLFCRISSLLQGSFAQILWSTHEGVPCMTRDLYLEKKYLTWSIHAHAIPGMALQVSSAEYRLFYRALLQKRPVILISILVTCLRVYRCVRKTQPSCGLHDRFWCVYTEIHIYIGIAASYGTPSCGLNDRFWCVTWLWMCDMTCDVWHDMIVIVMRDMMYATWQILTCECVNVWWSTLEGVPDDETSAVWCNVRHVARTCLFCRISSLLQGSFAKETCNFAEYRLSTIRTESFRTTI